MAENVRSVAELHFQADVSEWFLFGAVRLDTLKASLLSLLHYRRLLNVNETVEVATSSS